MLDELIELKVKKIVEKEYNKYVALNGSLIILSILLLGFSIFMKQIIILSPFFIVINLILLKFLLKRLRLKVRLIFNKALSSPEFKDYINKIEDRFIYNKFLFIKKLEEDISILDKIEEIETRRRDSYIHIYSALFNTVRHKIRVSSLSGYLSLLILSLFISFNLYLKILIILFILFSIYIIFNQI